MEAEFFGRTTKISEGCEQRFAAGDDEVGELECLNVAFFK